MFFSLFLGLVLLILNVAVHSPVPVLHVLCNCEIRCKNVHPVFLLNGDENRLVCGPCFFFPLQNSTYHFGH